MSLSITGNVIQDENLGLTTLAQDANGSERSGQQPHAVSAAPTPALGITWAGPSSQLAAGDPPDCNIAAGTSDIITVINSRIDIYSKTGAQLYDQTFQTFFNLPSNEFMFDPRVTWDQYSNRFIMTAGDQNGGSSQAFLDIAVSKDSNPLDGWYFYHFSLGANATSVDQPHLGIDASTVYLSASSPGGDTYSLWAVDRTALENNTASGLNRYTWASLGAPAGDTGRYTPAHTYGAATTPGDFMMEYVQNNSGNDTLNIIQTSNSHNGGTDTLVGKFQSLNVGDISDLPLAGGRQPGTSLLISVNNGFTEEGRIDNAVWRNNELYGVNEIRVGTGSTAHDVVHWFVVDTSNPNNLTLLSQGNIDPGSNYDTYYGAMTVDSSGNMIVGYSISGPTVYPSAAYAVIPVAGTGLEDGVHYLAQGQSSYTPDNAGIANNSRWGDYSGIAIDPSDNGSFWVFNQYATGQTTWATTIAGSTANVGQDLDTIPEVPILKIASSSLRVPAGGSVPLGIKVTPVDNDDNVLVTISGVPQGFETITADDGNAPVVHHGANYTFTAADVNSGLTLHSTYRGGGHPVNPLTVTASNTTAGETATSAPQVIMVTDPPAFATSASTANSDTLTDLMAQFGARGATNSHWGTSIGSLANDFVARTGTIPDLAALTEHFMGAPSVSGGASGLLAGSQTMAEEQRALLAFHHG
jgi:hypothetical protein